MLQKEQISCSLTVFTHVLFAPQLQVSVCGVGIPTRPLPALQHPVFSQHKTVRSGRKTGFLVNSDVVFVGPAFPNMYILSFPWTTVIFISGVWGQCPCVLPCFVPFHPWTWLRGIDRSSFLCLGRCSPAQKCCLFFTDDYYPTLGVFFFFLFFFWTRPRFTQLLLFFFFLSLGAFI